LQEEANQLKETLDRIKDENIKEQENYTNQIQALNKELHDIKTRQQQAQQLVDTAQEREQALRGL
jgi:hypothetical protein